MSLTSSSVKDRARAIGFDLCGVSTAVRHPRLARLAAWIADGRAGDMTYLARSLEEREDPRRVLASAESVVSVAAVYKVPESDVDAPPDGRSDGLVSAARYARGDDYHDVLKGRLRELVAWMATEAGPGFEAFSCIDNGPVQERVFAEQAGLGWIGKNTCLINPQIGSWMVLGEVIVSAALEPDRPGLDQCGSCTRCLDACPTGALPAPYVLDATRCLSYLTIEQRGPVDPALRPFIRDQFFGCDICQEVCPWNRRAAVSVDAAWMPRPPLAGERLVELCAMTDAEWSRVLRGSALRRAGLHRVRRSLAYATVHLPPAERACALDFLRSQPSSGDPQVAEAIGWASAAAR
jgi:epoxyqueuosine reductase